MSRLHSSRRTLEAAACVTQRHPHLLAPREAASALAVLKCEGVSVSFTATTPKQRAFKQHEDDGAAGEAPVMDVGWL